MTHPTNAYDFDYIWNRFPEKTNRHSSVWWYFLLFPKENGGYSRRQIMFTLVSIAGEQFQLNGKWGAGMRAQPVYQNGHELLDGMVLGWQHNGSQFHDRLVFEVVQHRLAPDSVGGWNQQANGSCLGGEIKQGGDKPLGVEVNIVGEKGTAHFTAWGNPDSLLTWPEHTLDIDTPLGGSRVVAWRQLQFAGRFGTPDGEEQLSGTGYFQRVCLDVPPFPWKWMWLTFDDDTFFSCFVPYAGPHLLRAGDFYFPQRIEQAVQDFRAGGYVSWQNAGIPRQKLDFSQVKVTPLLNQQKHPHFLVDCRSPYGDFLSFRAVPYEHAQFLLRRPLLNGRFHSTYNYNEYLFQAQDVDGFVAGKRITAQTVGNGFGNCEYTWGLGIG